MADLFAVGVTAGVPFTGTGTAWTLNALSTGGVKQLGADGTSQMVVTTATATAAMAAAVVTISPNGLNPNGQVTMATSAPAVLPSDQSFATAARFPIGPLPAQKGSTIVTIATTTETVIATAIASTKLDMYGLILANTSATATTVIINQATAGIKTIELEVPGTDTRGFMLNSGDGFSMATAGNNWTAVLGTSVSGVVVTALYILR